MDASVSNNWPCIWNGSGWCVFPVLEFFKISSQPPGHLLVTSRAPCAREMELHPGTDSSLSDCPGVVLDFLHCLVPSVWWFWQIFYLLQPQKMLGHGSWAPCCLFHTGESCVFLAVVQNNSCLSFILGTQCSEQPFDFQQFRRQEPLLPAPAMCPCFVAASPLSLCICALLPWKIWTQFLQKFPPPLCTWVFQGGWSFSATWG